MVAFARYNIELRLGVRFANGFQFFTDDAAENPLDLSEWTFRSEIRSDADELVFALDCEVTDTEGLVQVSKAAAGVVLPAGIDHVNQFRWDLIGTNSDGHIYQMIEGYAEIKPKVTSDA